ncbi:TPA: hypothetical protein ACRVWU_004813 [Escherichia coli]|nr:hypothetical protein [Escherichia coli]
MITKSSILIEYKDKSKLTESIYKFVNALDIDFSMLKYDYFDVNEYKKNITYDTSFIDKDAEYIELLAKIDFSYEVDFGTSTTSIESKYLPSLTDFIAQSLSQQLNCNIITSFKPLSGDEFCPITYFSKGKEVINFTTFNSNCWDGVYWVKKRRQTNIR